VHNNNVVVGTSMQHGCGGVRVVTLRGEDFGKIAIFWFDGGSEGQVSVREKKRFGERKKKESAYSTRLLTIFSTEREAAVSVFL